MRLYYSKYENSTHKITKTHTRTILIDKKQPTSNSVAVTSALHYEASRHQTLF